MTLDGVRILIVEDEALIAMLAEDMLESIGCKIVAVAATVRDAMATIEAHEFDAAMLDVNLNGDTSMGVASAVRAKGIPYVFTTGYGSDGVDADHAGAPVLAKPYVLGDLEAALRRCLDRQAAGTSSMTSITDSNRG